MRMKQTYLALARMNNEPDWPRAPQRRANHRFPERPNRRPGTRYQEIIGIGVLLAAVLVLLWSGSLIVLALGTFLLALLLLAGFLVIAWRRSR